MLKQHNDLMAESLAQAEIKGAIAELDRMNMKAFKLLRDYGGEAMSTQAFIDDCTERQNELQAQLKAEEGDST